MKLGRLIIVLFLLIVVAGGVWLYSRGGFSFLSKPVVELKPVSESDYNRKLRGTFEALNVDQATISIWGSDKKLYYFSVPVYMIENQDQDILVEKGTKVEVKWRAEESMEEIFSKFAEDPTKPLNDDINSFSIYQIK